MKTTFAVLIAALLVHPATFAAHNKEIPVNSGRSVRQQVDSFAELMDKEMSAAKNNKEKFRAMNRAEDQINALRDNAVTQSAQDESYMDLMVSVLDSLPEEKEFKRKDCAKYEADLLNQFDPTADDAPVEPAVKPGWLALQSLCK